MKTTRSILTFVLALATLTAVIAPAAVAAPGDDASGDAFRALLEPYEGARQALAADRLAAARDSGAGLHRVLGRIAGDLTAESAGIAAEDLAEVRALVPELETAAEALAEAADLDAARDAFYALTKPLVRWRQAAGEGPNVAYCSMKKRSWLQPGDAIGNPYYGPAMSNCGEVVGG